MSAQARVVSTIMEVAGSEAALFLDVDGTLVNVARTPSHEPLKQDHLSTLSALSARLPLVAVVSGRPAWSLGALFPIPQVRLLGLYGLVEWTQGMERPLFDVDPWHILTRDAVSELTRLARDVPEFEVRDKRYSVAVHWADGTSLSLRESLAKSMRAVCARDGFELYCGKDYLELVPGTGAGKGRIIGQLLGTHSGAVPVYIGDDLGDYTAFREARLRGGLAIGVSDGDRTPNSLLTEVDVVVNGPTEVWALLDDFSRILMSHQL